MLRKSLLAMCVAFRIIWHTSGLVICRTSSESGVKSLGKAYSEATSFCEAEAAGVGLRL